MTVDRLQAVHMSLLKLRDSLTPDQKAIMDEVIPEIFQAMREIQTGPSLHDQAVARIMTELSQIRADHQLELAKLRPTQQTAQVPPFVTWPSTPK